MPEMPPKPAPVRPGRESPPGPLEAPRPIDEWSDLRAVSLRCVHTEPESFCRWHQHPFEELCLITDDVADVGVNGKEFSTPPNTLVHYRPGESHGYWNRSHQRPRFWVVHFAADSQLRKALPGIFADPTPGLRQTLTVAQVETFKWLFLRLSAEHSHPTPSCAFAESAWLRLLLVNVHRWATRETALPVTPTQVQPELMRLWQMIQDCSGRPAEFKARLRDFPNYNSVRQAFTTVFGCSPSQLALHTRIQIARNLLVETPLSIKQIAGHLGYVRQHEFTRAFHRLTGCSPTVWRAAPR